MASEPAGPVPTGAQWPLTLKGYDYNVDEAKRLLDAAGAVSGD